MQYLPVLSVQPTSPQKHAAPLLCPSLTLIYPKPAFAFGWIKARAHLDAQVLALPRLQTPWKILIWYLFVLICGEQTVLLPSQTGRLLMNNNNGIGIGSPLYQTPPNYSKDTSHDVTHSMFGVVRRHSKRHIQTLEIITKDFIRGTDYYYYYYYYYYKIYKAHKFKRARVRGAIQTTRHLFCQKWPFYSVTQKNRWPGQVPTLLVLQGWSTRAENYVGVKYPQKSVLFSVHRDGEVTPPEAIFRLCAQREDLHAEHQSRPSR